MPSKIRTKKTNIALSHLYVESKIVKLIETERRMVVTRGWGCGEMGDVYQRGNSFIRCISIIRCITDVLNYKMDYHGNYS